MKLLIRLEELGIFCLSILSLYKLGINFGWWLNLLLFLSPDIGMLGYAANSKLGAITYNLFHHKAVAGIVTMLGVLQGNDYMLFAGLILFAHSSFDRVLGFGLKYPDNFKHTNIGYM